MDGACFRFPKFNKCCAFLELRLGGLTIGGLSLVFALVSVCIDFAGFAAFDKNESAFTSNVSSQLTTLILDIANVILAGFLIFGIMKNRYSLLLPYLWFDAVTTLLYIAIAVVIVFINVGKGFLMFFFGAIMVYFWLIINSLYQEMYVG